MRQLKSIVNIVRPKSFGIKSVSRHHSLPSTRSGRKMSAIDDNKDIGNKAGGMPPGSSKRDLLETVNEEYTDLN